MKKISVAIIDDNKEYSWLIENRLREKGMNVIGRFTHEMFGQIIKLKNVKMFLISFRVEIDAAFQTLVSVQEKYPTVKIIVYACVTDKPFVDQVMTRKIQGLVFNVETDPQGLVNAIQIVLPTLHETILFPSTGCCMNVTYNWLGKEKTAPCGARVLPCVNSINTDVLTKSAKQKINLTNC